MKKAKGRRLRRDERVAVERAKADLPVVHPACALFPLMNDAELLWLADGIREHGQALPIVTFEGQILDGKCRWIACRIAGVEPRCQPWIPGERGNPWWYSWNVNAVRRTCNADQRAVLIIDLMNVVEPGALDDDEEEDDPAGGEQGSAA